MIVKANLDPRQVARYTAAPMAWAAGWAIVVPAAYVLTDDDRLLVPFPPIATIGAALALVVAFRNNAAIVRWNEARAAWQNVLVASRTLLRQIVASTDNAVATGAIDPDAAVAFRRDTAGHLITFARALADQTRPGHRSHGRTLDISALSPDLGDARRPEQVLVHLAVRVKDGIRLGALGQFDPISLEPQLVALNTAQGVVERIATTPTPRQYDYFTRRTIGLFSLLAPFGVLSTRQTPTRPDPDHRPGGREPVGRQRRGAVARPSGGVPCHRAGSSLPAGTWVPPRYSTEQPPAGSSAAAPAGLGLPFRHATQPRPRTAHRSVRRERKREDRSGVLLLWRHPGA